MRGVLALLSGCLGAAQSQSSLTIDGTALLALVPDGLASVTVDWHKDDEGAYRRWPVNWSQWLQNHVNSHDSTRRSAPWVGMSAMKLPLDHPLLVGAASALAPGLLRIGGTKQDRVVYDVPEFGSTCAAMGEPDPACKHHGI